VELNPKLGHIALAALQFAQQFVHHVHTVGGMAVLHLAADDGLGAHKDALRPLGEIAHRVILIDQRDIDRQVFEQQVDLLKSESARIQSQLALVQRLVGRLGPRQWLRLHVGLPLVAGANQGIADLVALIANGQPFRVAEHLERRGEEDVFLLVEHRPDRL